MKRLLMRRRPLFIAIGLLLPATVALAFVLLRAPRLVGPARPGNVADGYRRAVSLLPAAQTEAALSGRWRTFVLSDANEQELLKSLTPSMEALREAAPMADCDWGFATSPGDPLKQVPVFAKDFKRLVYAGAFCTRQRINRDQPADGLRDCLAVLNVSRRLSHATAITYRIIGLAGEETMINAAQRTPIF